MMVSYDLWVTWYVSLRFQFTLSHAHSLLDTPFARPVTVLSYNDEVPIIHEDV